MTVLTTLAAAAAPLLAYRPFLDPLPVWDYWAALLLPLTVAVAVVYKSIRCATMSRVPREAASLTVWIVVGMGAAAVVLGGVVELLER